MPFTSTRSRRSTTTCSGVNVGCAAWRTSPRRDAEEFLALAAAIPIRTIADVYPLAEANQALADLARGDVGGAAVLVP